MLKAPCHNPFRQNRANSRKRFQFGLGGRIQAAGPDKASPEYMDMSAACSTVGTRICSPSLSGAARFKAASSAEGKAPPAASTA